MLMAVHLPHLHRACAGRHLVEYITVGVLRATFADSTLAGATINNREAYLSGILL